MESGEMSYIMSCASFISSDPIHLDPSENNQMMRDNGQKG